MFPDHGKTTLCSKLASSLKYQHIDMDSVIISFERAFPQTEVIHTDFWDFKYTSKKIINFMKNITEIGNYDKLKHHIKEYIEISKWLQQECEKYNLPFIDLSINREKVVNKLLLEI